MSCNQMQGSLLIWPIMVIWPLDVAVTTLRCQYASLSFVVTRSIRLASTNLTINDYT